MAAAPQGVILMRVDEGERVIALQSAEQGRGRGMKTVTVYTDGACSGNPGPGGWAAILKYGTAEKVLSGGAARRPPTTAWSSWG